MTGTAMTEEAEFGKIYNLEVTSIPTNKTDIRLDLPDVIYKTEEQKFKAVAGEIAQMTKIGRPVLVGTISIEKSEYLSALLKKMGIKHNILNAKHHEKEAYIIAQAGRVGAVTIATNMAGRGTDILLGGNPEYMAKEQLEKLRINPDSKNYEEKKKDALNDAKKITEAEHKKVVDLGGLHVIGTERHESRRIDNQLRGRAARQGDPGSTRFFLSLQDNLMITFGGQKVAGLMDILNVQEDMAIESKMITRQIQSSQRKVETYYFDIRKNVLEYDDVMNAQRENFYAQRKKVLEDKDVSQDILYMIEKEVERIICSYISPGMSVEEYVQEDIDTMAKEIKSTFPQYTTFNVVDIEKLKYDKMYEKLSTEIVEAYKTYEKNVVNEYNEILSQYHKDFVPQTPLTANSVMRDIERDILLKVIDAKWTDHLHNIEMLRDGIGLRAYGQKDPLIEYKKEAFDMFNNMMHEIQSETVKYLFRAKFGITFA